MGSTNKKLRGKLEDCVRAMRAAREAIAIAQRYVPKEWKRTMLNAIEYLTEQISNNKMETFNSGLNRDDSSELPKNEYKMAENEKHFEPETSWSLAERIMKTFSRVYNTSTEGLRNTKSDIQAIIEPHIRKPSDDEWMKRASYLLQRCAISGSDGCNGYHLPSELRKRVREFLNKGYVMADEQWVEANIATSTVDEGSCPESVKDLRQTKSVPQRCEEAYNEAISLLHGAWNTIRESGTGSEIENWRDRAAKLMVGPNPFKEADIVKEDVDAYMDILEKERSQPKKYPFDLGLAAQGHKVVTRDGRDAKVVAEGLTGSTPILVVVTNKDKTKHAYCVSTDGRLAHESKTDNPADLFILKEPETIDLSIFRHKEDGSLDVITRYESYMNRDKWEFIKTITVTI